jgi:hypothetical protein
MLLVVQLKGKHFIFIFIYFIWTFLCKYKFVFVCPSTHKYMKEMILVLEVISYHGILCGEQKASHERVCMVLSFVLRILVHCS